MDETNDHELLTVEYIKSILDNKFYNNENKIQHILNIVITNEDYNIVKKELNKSYNQFDIFKVNDHIEVIIKNNEDLLIKRLYKIINNYPEPKVIEILKLYITDNSSFNNIKNMLIENYSNIKLYKIDPNSEEIVNNVRFLYTNNRKTFYHAKTLFCQFLSIYITNQNSFNRYIDLINILVGLFFTKNIINFFDNTFFLFAIKKRYQYDRYYLRNHISYKHIINLIFIVSWKLFIVYFRYIIILFIIVTYLYKFIDINSIY